MSTLLCKLLEASCPELAQPPALLLYYVPLQAFSVPRLQRGRSRSPEPADAASRRETKCSQKHSHTLTAQGLGNTGYRGRSVTRRERTPSMLCMINDRKGSHKRERRMREVLRDLTTRPDVRLATTLRSSECHCAAVKTRVRLCGTGIRRTRQAAGEKLSWASSGTVA